MSFFQMYSIIFRFFFLQQNTIHNLQTMFIHCTQISMSAVTSRWIWTPHIDKTGGCRHFMINDEMIHASLPVVVLKKFLVDGVREGEACSHHPDHCNAENSSIHRHPGFQWIQDNLEGPVKCRTNIIHGGLLYGNLKVYIFVTAQRKRGS